MTLRHHKRVEFEREALPHLDALYGMALRLTKDERDAEDLVQDTMVKAFRFFHRFETGSNIRAWLFKVLVNTFYNTCRKQRNIQRVHTEAEIDGHMDLFISAASTAGRKGEAEILGLLAAEQIRAAMEELPEEFRLAVILCDIHDFSYKEIAEILSCPVGTVMSRLYRGRRLLQKKLYDCAVERGYIKKSSDKKPPEKTTDLATYRRRKEGM